MKNILFLLHIAPPIHGSSMVGKWIKESKLINNTFSCRYINLLASNSVGETGKITSRKLLGFIGIWIKLLNALVCKKPDVCYFALTTTGAAFYRDSLLVALLRLFGVKRLFHLHNKGVIYASNSKINHRLYRFVFKDADVILLSQYLYSDIQQFVPKNKIHICPNGIPELAIRETITPNNTRTTRGITQNILFLSNLIESKGVFVLLEAMALLKQKRLPFQGIFVGGEGDVSASQFQEKLIKLNLTKHVKYLGKKYGNEKDAIFQQADIFAFPTFYSNECFPLVLLEAMQHQLPIISTPEGGIRDIVNDGLNGFLIPQKDVDQLAKKLEQLILRPEHCKQMGKIGRKKYEEYYTLNMFETRLNNILHKITND